MKSLQAKATKRPIAAIIPVANCFLNSCPKVKIADTHFLGDSGFLTRFFCVFGMVFWFVLFLLSELCSFLLFFVLLAQTFCFFLMVFAYVLFLLFDFGLNLIDFCEILLVFCSFN